MLIYQVLIKLSSHPDGIVVQPVVEELTAFVQNVEKGPVLDLDGDRNAGCLARFLRRNAPHRHVHDAVPPEGTVRDDTDLSSTLS